MPQLKAIEKKINTVKDIESVVSTMKTLAAVNINNFQKATESAEDYVKIVESGLQITLQKLLDRNPTEYWKSGFQEREGRILYLLIGSEQGMCGSFNERVMSEIENKEKNPFIIVLGSRMMMLAKSRDYEVVQETRLPSSMTNLHSLITDLQIDVYRQMKTNRIREVKMVYNKMSSGEKIFTTKIGTLYPIDPGYLQNIRERKWNSRCIPVVLMNGEQMFSRLLDHYLSGRLYAAITNSLASENEARLASMQAAERNIQEKKSSLYTQYNKVRQQSITSELLDIIGGFEVLS